jgi:hypothetical protein
MWEPKYKELKEKAFDIAFDYKELVAVGNTSAEAVANLSREYKMAIKSIYRYLKYAKVELRGRSDRRNDNV